MGAVTHHRIVNSLIDWLASERPPPEVPLSNFDRLRHEIRPCDVILIEGRSRVSNVIKAVTQSCWSHAALYIGRVHDVENSFSRRRVQRFFDGPPDVQLIVESELGRGTVVRPLHAYERDHIRVCRPRELNWQDAQKVIDFAVSQLGTDYNVRQIIDLFRFLMPWGVLPRRWRSTLFTYRPGSPTRTVCSTMIAEAFAQIQYPILPLVKKVSASGDIRLFRRNPKLCVPRDFDYSPYFDVIKYPYIDFSHAKMRYRLLPWSTQGGGLTAEENGFYLEESDIDPRRFE